MGTGRYTYKNTITILFGNVLDEPTIEWLKRFVEVNKDEMDISDYKFGNVMASEYNNKLNKEVTALTVTFGKFLYEVFRWKYNLYTLTDLYPVAENAYAVIDWDIHS